MIVHQDRVIRVKVLRCQTTQTTQTHMLPQAEEKERMITWCFWVKQGHLRSFLGIKRSILIIFFNEFLVEFFTKQSCTDKLIGLFSIETYIVLFDFLLALNLTFCISPATIRPVKKVLKKAPWLKLEVL